MNWERDVVRELVLYLEFGEWTEANMNTPSLVVDRSAIQCCFDYSSIHGIDRGAINDLE